MIGALRHAQPQAALPIWPLSELPHPPARFRPPPTKPTSAAMFSCSSTCAPRDPVADTVKVNLPSVSAEEMEERRLAEEAEARARQRAAEEAERRAAEEARRRAALEAEAAAQRKREQEEAERKRSEEAARRAEEARQLELQRQREEAERLEAARKAEAERLAKERERKAHVAAFLKQNGFSGVAAPKKSLFKTTYPIHVAAELGDERMVELLLLEGADATQKNSAGKTAAQLAQKKDKKGSHAPVVRALGGC